MTSTKRNWVVGNAHVSFFICRLGALCVEVVF